MDPEGVYPLLNSLGIACQPRSREGNLLPLPVSPIKSGSPCNLSLALLEGAEVAAGGSWDRSREGSGTPHPAGQPEIVAQQIGEGTWTCDLVQRGREGCEFLSD